MLRLTHKKKGKLAIGTRTMRWIKAQEKSRNGNTSIEQARTWWQQQQAAKRLQTHTHKQTNGTFYGFTVYRVALKLLESDRRDVLHGYWITLYINNASAFISTNSTNLSARWMCKYINRIVRLHFNRCRRRLKRTHALTTNFEIFHPFSRRQELRAKQNWTTRWKIKNKVKNQNHRFGTLSI